MLCDNLLLLVALCESTRGHVTEGKRAVLFESRIGASCLSWIQMQPSVAEFSRAVSYESPKTRVEYQVMGAWTALMITLVREFNAAVTLAGIGCM